MAGNGKAPPTLRRRCASRIGLLSLRCAQISFREGLCCFVRVTSLRRWQNISAATGSACTECCVVPVNPRVYRSPPSPPSSPPPPSSFLRGAVWFGNGARVSGLTLIGARVVGGGGIVAGGSLTTVRGG